MKKEKFNAFLVRALRSKIKILYEDDSFNNITIRAANSVKFIQLPCSHFEARRV